MSLPWGSEGGSCIRGLETSMAERLSPLDRMEDGLFKQGDIEMALLLALA